MPRIWLTPFTSLASLGLLLSASVAAQPAPGFPLGPSPGAPSPAPGFPAGPPGTAYAAPGFPAQVPPGRPYVGPDGLTYLYGAPVYFAYGTYLPLVFVAGFGWGYYGPGHRWFGAPVPLRARLDHFYPGGRGFASGPGYRNRGFHRDEGHFDHR